jgi:hypothetical protein
VVPDGQYTYDIDARDTAGASPSAAPITVSGPGGTGAISKLLVIMEENHLLAQVAAGMPYLFSLAHQFGHATDYSAVSHPSLPNHLAITAGPTFGITSDSDPGNPAVNGPSVFDVALDAGKTPRRTTKA